MRCAFICTLFLSAVPSTSTQPQYAVHDEEEHTAQDEHDKNDTLLPPRHVITPTEGDTTSSPFIILQSLEQWPTETSEHRYSPLRKWHGYTITMPCWEKLHYSNLNGT